VQGYPESTRGIYSDCDLGFSIDKLHIFNEYQPLLLPEHTITWTAIIQAHTINTEPTSSSKPIFPNAEGRCFVEDFIQEKYSELCYIPAIVVASLISLYAKCADLKRATKISSF
jgi:hypothetical protein